MTNTTTTVEELIAFLQAQDQEATVEVVIVDPDDEARFVDLNLDEHIHYTDLRGNRFVGEDSSLFNKRFLKIGETCF